MEGRTHKPVIDNSKCNVCSICSRGCPAETELEMRSEKDTLRGKIYYRYWGGERPASKPLLNPLPACQDSCPLKQDARRYIQLIAEGQFSMALQVIRETNPLPAVCGYICHHPCETACVKNAIDTPPPIRSLKQFVVDNYHQEAVLPVIEAANGFRVAIIGSGPAGLTAAYDLAKTGCRVDMYESHHKAGGMLAWAIPDFRLPGEILKRDIDVILNMGVKIHTGVRFGGDLSYEDLTGEGADAVVIAIGTTVGVKMGIPNEDNCKGSLDCLTLLEKQAAGGKAEIGKEVLVIGGGNAAVDTARTSRRLGAPKVSLLYRRGLEEMPADQKEVKEALEEGVEIQFLTAPLEIMTTAGNVSGLKCARTELIKKPGSQRPKPVIAANSEFVLSADTILSAIGQTPDYAVVAGGLSLKPDWRLPEKFCEETMIKQTPGVFAAGDFVNGATTVVEAMASGKRTAQAVLAYLNSKRSREGNRVKG